MEDALRSGSTQSQPAADSFPMIKLAMAQPACHLEEGEQVHSEARDWMI
jgi:hypothetical protein